MAEGSPSEEPRLIATTSAPTAVGVPTGKGGASRTVIYADERFRRSPCA